MTNLPNHVIGFPFPLAHLVHEWVESCGYKPSRTAPSKTPLFTLCPPARLLQPCRGGTGVYSGLQSLCGLFCLFLAGHPAMPICTYVSLAHMEHTFESHHPPVLTLRGVRETPPFWLASLTPVPTTAQVYTRFLVTIC